MSEFTYVTSVCGAVVGITIAGVVSGFSNFIQGEIFGAMLALVMVVIVYLYNKS